MKPRVREVIVVEGRYDRNTLLQAVDAAVVEVGGFALFNDREKAAYLRRLAEARGVILLTDPDGAGFVLRSHLKGLLRRRLLLLLLLFRSVRSMKPKRNPARKL